MDATPSSSKRKDSHDEESNQKRYNLRSKKNSNAPETNDDDTSASHGKSKYIMFKINKV